MKGKDESENAAVDSVSLAGTRGSQDFDGGGGEETLDPVAN